MAARPFAWVRHGSAGLALAALGALFGGCASELRPSSLAAPAALTADPRLQPAANAGYSSEDLAATRPSLAGKVLAALALERVTGRKPDPAHFAPH